MLSESNGMTILSEEYQNAADSLRYDVMDLFYVDFTKMALRTITYTRGRQKSYDVNLAPLEDGGNYLLDGLTTQDIEIMENEIKIETDKIIENAVGSNYQKIQYIHNYLIDNIDYDSTYIAEHNRDIYGALLKKSVVWEGNAKTFKYILDKVVIPCIIVGGDAINSRGLEEKHMWNYVKINNMWYGVDVTWDDPILTNGGDLPDEFRYRYFCQGDNINENHVLNYKITSGGQTYAYPKLYNKENEEIEWRNILY